MQALMQSRHLRIGIRDCLVGLAIYVAVLGGLAGEPIGWSLSSASASDPAIAQAIDIALSAAPASDNAVLSAHLLRPIAGPDSSRATALSLLGLTFSLIFAFNLAISRHLRRVYASPRRGEWRRDR